MISLALIWMGSFYFAWKRVRRYLRYLQQEEYDCKRFSQWLFKNRAFDQKGTAVALVASAALLLIDHFVINFAAVISLLFVSFFESDPRTEGKLRLNMTERASRIYWLSLTLYGLVLSFYSAVTMELSFAWLAQVLMFQMIPFFLMLSTILLNQEEKKRQQVFLKEAKEKWNAIAPFTIGITGSYGKTSTKDALGMILQITLGPTFWPAKGINTPMGITREIRNNLQEEQKFAVIEMGAYGIGSIKRLCDLTPPDAAIITVVGKAHLERFQSQENIRTAKSELAQALPEAGILVCNGDNEGARWIAENTPKKRTLLYGFENNLGSVDCLITSFQIISEGTSFTLQYKGKHYKGITPLFGKAALSNVIASFVMACELGANPEYVLGVIRNLKPVDNRLQVQKDRQITYIHDAYNSNPQGFESALEVAGALNGKRTILMTPGMIELGEEQNRENERLGKMAAVKCDLALIVGETNRNALHAGLKSGGFSEQQIFVCATRTEAFATLAKLKKPDDVILIENDLSDLYEAKEKF